MATGIEIAFRDTPPTPLATGPASAPSARAPSPDGIPSAVRAGSRALLAEARHAPAPPSASQCRALREQLSQDSIHLEALRPRVGEAAYLMARAANLMSRLDQGMVDLPKALDELKTLRAACAGLSDDREAIQSSLEAVEREVLVAPLRGLARLAVENGTGKASAFRDFSAQLSTAMDTLRLGGNDQQSVQRAFAQLQSLQARALADDGLYAALPHPQGKALRAGLSAALQTLLQAAQSRLGILNDAPALKNEVALFNIFSRAAEEASRPGYDAGAFREMLRPALEAHGLALPADFFSAELQVLQTENLSQRAALDLLHGLQAKLRAAGVDQALPQRAQALREQIGQADASQFARGAARAADFLPKPAAGEEAAFFQQTAELSIRRAMNGGDVASAAEWQTLVQDMELLNLAPTKFDAETLARAVDLRQTRAAWQERPGNSDVLAQAASDAGHHLEGLEEGPDRTLLGRELDAFSAFRAETEATIGEDAARCLGDVSDVLRGSPSDLKKIGEMETRLDGALTRLERNQQAGEALKGELRAQISEAKSQLVLKRLDGELGVLQSARATPLSLQALQEKYEENPAAQEKIEAFSQARAAELKAEISRVGLSEPGGAGAKARTELERLDAQASRLLLAGEQDGIGGALAEKRQALASELGERAFAALGTKVTENLTGEEQTRLKTLFGHCLGSEALVRHLNKHPGTAKRLAEIAAAPGADFARRIDDLLLRHSSLDQAALEMKQGLAGKDGRDQATAQHTDARLRRQTFQLIRDNGGKDLLAALGVKDARELSFERLGGLLACTVAPDGKGAPSFTGNAFNTLLVQSAWSAFLQERGRSGNDADLRAFQEQLPEPLKNADPQVLRGMFRLGPLSGADMREASRFAASGGALVAAADVGRLMDRFCEHSAPLRAQRALTVLLRNMLDSAGIEYKPEDNDAGAYAKALTDGLGRRRVAPLGGAVADAFKRAVGALSEASGLAYEGQVEAALAHFQAASGALARVQRTERELARARGALDEASRALQPPDWKALAFKPGEQFAAEGTDARKTQMADPWRVLRYQKALNPESQTIDVEKIIGEPLSLQVLAFRDVLEGRVEGLDTPDKQLEALQGISIPSKINFKRMDIDRFPMHEEPEAKAFREKLVQLRALQPNEGGFAQKFAESRQGILNDIASYALDAKAELILSLKNGNAGVRVRESSGKTVSEAVRDVQEYGESATRAVKQLALEHTVGDRGGVSHAAAMTRGLGKIGLEKPAAGSAGETLRRHFMTGDRLLQRGAGANLIEANARALRAARGQVEQKQALLDTAQKDLSTHSSELLQEATRMAALQAFVTMGYADFAEAEEALRGENRQFLDQIVDNLVNDFSVTRQFAEFLVTNFVQQPVAREDFGVEGRRGAVFERFCAEALPSAGVAERQRAIDRQLAAPVRQLVQEESSRRRFANLLDQLEPNSAMDFSAGARAEVRLAANLGAVQASAAIGVAREKGISLGRNEDGQYELAIRGDFSGGLGVGVSALSGAASGSLGVSAAGSECLSFTFQSREDAAAFLQKMSDKTWSPEDLFRHCLNVRKSDSLGGGIVLAAQVELGEWKVMDNSPVGQPVFSLGFELSGSLERRTETDAGKQTLSSITTAQGRIGLSLSVGRSEEQTEAEKLKASQKTAAEGADATRDAAAPSGVEVGDETRAVFWRGVTVDAGVKVEDGAVNCSLSVAATRSSTVTRSTRGDTRGAFVNAAHGTTLSFSGTYAQTQFTQYARENLKLEEVHVQAMLADIRQDGADGFTVQVEHELDPATAEQCRNLERTGSEGAEAAAKLLKDESHYALSSVTLEFQGRSASEQRNLGLSRGSVQVGVTWEAAANETFRVVYQASASGTGLLTRE
ncbi:MAG: hypothetical protein LBE85_02700 [Candidatus Accumulibacter sp.]|jgi:hypothetical protein|nr:hypothetical protein [Accumulibacter sp.]